MTTNPPPRKRVLSIRIPEIDILHCYDLLSSAGVDVSGTPMSTAVMSFLDAALNTAEKQGLTQPYETNAEIELALAAYVPPDKQPGEVVFDMPLSIEPVGDLNIQPPVGYDLVKRSPQAEPALDSPEDLLAPFIEAAKDEVDGDFNNIQKEGADLHEEAVSREPVEKVPPWQDVKMTPLSELEHSPMLKEIKELNDPLAILALRFSSTAMPESMRDTPTAKDLFNRIYLIYQNYLQDNPGVEIPTEE